MFAVNQEVACLQYGTSHWHRTRVFFGKVVRITHNGKRIIVQRTDFQGTPFEEVYDQNGRRKDNPNCAIATDVEYWRARLVQDKKIVEIKNAFNDLERILHNGPKTEETLTALEEKIAEIRKTMGE